MATFLIKNLIIFGSAVFMAVLIDHRKSLRGWPFLLLFVVFGLIDNMLIPATQLYPDLQLMEYQVWNNIGCAWSAKLYSIILALVLLIPLKRCIKPDEIGLTFRQNKGSIKFSLLCVLFFLIAAVCSGFFYRKGPFSSGVLLYMALMPGLNEELIYRGFLLGFMNKIFDKNFRLFGIYFGWGAVLTAVVFGLLHGFRLTDSYQVQIDVFPISYSALYGFIFALIRERSGSLVFPVIAHNTANFFVTLVRMV